MREFQFYEDQNYKLFSFAKISVTNCSDLGIEAADDKPGLSGTFTIPDQRSYFGGLSLAVGVTVVPIWSPALFLVQLCS